MFWRLSRRGFATLGYTLFMDSLSQILLGAAVAEVTLGKKIGRSALIIGGALATLPDLDILVHYTDAVASFTYHRSWSHSIFVLSLISLPMAWLLDKIYRVKFAKERLVPSYRNWLTCTWLVLITHPLLDGFTIYGTQLLWPLQTPPIAWGTLFIIDPLYTVPLLIAFIVAWKKRARALQAAALGLIFSTTYIGVSVLSQQHARMVAMKSLNKQSISNSKVLIAPSPFSILWRIISMDGEHYYEGFYSLLDKDHDISFDRYPSNRNVIDSKYEQWAIERLDWFTQGFISAVPTGERLFVNDLRMGIESSYVFRFDVGPLDSNQTSTNTITHLLPLRFNTSRLKALVHRVIDEEVAVPVDE